MSEPRSKLFQPQTKAMKDEEQLVKFGLQIPRRLKVWLDMEAGRRQIQKRELIQEVLERYIAWQEEQDGWEKVPTHEP